MIGAGSTGGAVEDSGSVLLEDSLVSLDGDGNWLLGNSSLHLGWVLGEDIGVGLGGAGTDTGGLGCIVSARAILGGVLVGGLGLSILALEEVEGLVLPSTIATEVLGGAVDELLLTEREEVAGGNLVGTLEGTGGGEGPA